MRLRWAFVAAVLVTTFTAGARADLVSPYGGETAPNFVEIDVDKGRVLVTFEIDRSDYPLFVEEASGDSQSLAERTGKTLQVGADGVQIEPVTLAVGVRPRTPLQTARQASPLPRERSAEVVFAKLEYPLVDQPSQLSFTPPLTEEGRTAATIGMLVTHAGVPVTDYRYLSQPETLFLDWDDPWFTAFENPNLTRHHKSPLMSFIAIEPREVRHEILFRLRDLEAWTDLDLSGALRLDRATIDEVQSQAAAFFAAHNPLVIDGVLREPAAAKVQVVDIDVTGLRVVEDPDKLDPVSALFGVVLSYPHKTLPQGLTMSWELFPEGLEEVPAMVTDPAGGVPARLTPAAPEVAWTNFLRTWEDPQVTPVLAGAHRSVEVPMLSVVLVGVGAVSAAGVAMRRARPRWLILTLVALVVAPATTQVGAVNLQLAGGEPPPEAMTSVVQEILSNASVAMLETDGGAFEEALSVFVAGAEMDEVAAEMRRGLAVTLPSGARARTDAIDAVTVEAITPQDDGLSVLATWTSQVSGGHWGHLHQRAIHYRALVDLTEPNGVWQLAGLTVVTADIED